MDLNVSDPSSSFSFASNYSSSSCSDMTGGIFGGSLDDGTDFFITFSEGSDSEDVGRSLMSCNGPPDSVLSCPTIDTMGKSSGQLRAVELNEDLSTSVVGCILVDKEASIKELGVQMSGDKATVWLSWQPNLALFPSTGKEKCSQTEISALYKPDSQLVDGLFLPPNDPRKLNKLLKKQVKDTAGKKWFDMPAQTITPELKKDLQLLKLRSAIDPKRHYKKGASRSKALPKYFQVGTVIESASEFFTGRLTKKERKATLADELLSDTTLRDYRKRKVREIEEIKRPAGVDKWKRNKLRKHGKTGKKSRLQK